jgi:phage terminase small subunit
MGRKALPTELKRQKGTLKPSRTNLSEPKVELVHIPDPPQSCSDLERTSWLRLRDALQALNVVAVSDLISFELMVQSVSEFYALKSNPDSTFKDRREASKAAREWLSVFGLTPSSRSSVAAIVGQKAVDELGFLDS